MALFDATKKLVGSIVGKAKEEVKKVAEVTKPFFDTAKKVATAADRYGPAVITAMTPAAPVAAARAIVGPEKFNKAIIKGGADILRAAPRAVVSTGLMGARPAVELATGKKAADEYTPKTALEKTLLGPEPIKSLDVKLTNTNKTIEQALPEQLKKKGIGAVAGLPLVVGSTALDLLPLPEGGAAKGAATAGEKLLGKEVVEGITRKLGATPAAEQIIAKESEKAALTAYNKLQEGRELIRKTGAPKLFERLKSGYEDLATRFVDTVMPIESRLEKAVAKSGKTIEAAKDFSHQYDKSLRSKMIARQFVEDSGLSDVIRSFQNEEELGHFNQYLIDRHVPEREAAGLATGRNVDEAVARVQTLAPRFEEQAKRVGEYSQKLLDYSVQSGLISQELADGLRAKYQNYVPLQRVFSELEGPVGDAFRAPNPLSLASQKTVRKAVGSEREIEDPLTSLLDNTFRAFSEGEKNKTIQNMVDTSLGLPENPLQLTRVPEGEKVPKDAIAVLRDGKVERYTSAIPSVIEAAKGFSPTQMTLVSKVLAFPARLKKLGTTGVNVGFAAVNLPRDLYQQVILSPSVRDTVLNPSVVLTAFQEAAKSALGMESDLVADAVRNGALMSSFDIARETGAPGVGKIFAGRSLAANAKYTITHPKEWMAAVEDLLGAGETAGRLVQYEGIKRAALKAGKSAEEAAMEAAKAARNTGANFARQGSESTWIRNLMNPYFSANINGIRSLTRAMRERPAETAGKIAVGLYTPLAGAVAWNTMDQKRKAIWDEISEQDKDSNIILVTPKSYIDDKNTAHNVIKIPLPAGLGALTRPFRKGLEQWQGGDPVTWKDFVYSLTTTATPFSVDIKKGQTPMETAAKAGVNVVAPYALPMAQAMSKFDFYTGRKTVPQSLEGLPEDLQVKENTSFTARKLAKPLQVSPIVFEKFIKDTAGGVGSQALNLADKILSEIGVAPKEQVGGESLWGNFKRRFTEAYASKSSDAAYANVDKLKEESARKKVQVDDRVAQEIDYFKKLPAEERSAQWSAFAEKEPEIAQKVIDQVEQDKLGYTPYEKQLRYSLGVGDGSRANAIYSEINKLKTKEEKSALWKKYVQKKLITEDVAEQLQNLLAGREYNKSE